MKRIISTSLVLLGILMVTPSMVGATSPTPPQFNHPVIFESEEYFAIIDRIKELKYQLQQLVEKRTLDEGRVVIDDIVAANPKIGEFISLKARGLTVKQPVDIFFGDHVAVEKILPSSSEYIAFNVPQEVSSWAQCLAWDNPGGVQCKLGQVKRTIAPGEHIVVRVRNSNGFSEPYSIRIAR